MTRLVCSCESPYVNTTDGRHQHRMIHGHTPTERVIVHEPSHRTEKCAHDKHHLCGGGVLGGFACSCGCHDGGR